MISKYFLLEILGQPLYNTQDLLKKTERKILVMNLPSGDLLEINGHNFLRSSQRLRQWRCEGAEESHDSCESCDRSEE